MLIYGSSTDEQDNEEWDIEELGGEERGDEEWDIQMFGEGGEGEWEGGEENEGNEGEEPEEPNEPEEPTEEPWEPNEEPHEEPFEEPDEEPGEHGGDDEPDEGSGGGTKPLPKTLQDVINYINEKFPGKLNDNYIVSTGANGLPLGYTMNQDGSFTSPSGDVVAGFVYKSGDITFIHLSMSIFDPNRSAATRDGLIGHELLHAKHIEQYADIYLNDRAQFNLNSELAGYIYQYERAIFGFDQIAANFALQEINKLIALGAQGGFTTTL